MSKVKEEAVVEGRCMYSVESYAFNFLLADRVFAVCFLVMLSFVFLTSRKNIFCCLACVSKTS